ncbi:MAG: hypothetical protein ACFFAS_06960 [Promethearchaeota archaeon]
MAIKNDITNYYQQDQYLEIPINKEKKKRKAISSVEKYLAWKYKSIENQDNIQEKKNQVRDKRQKYLQYAQRYMVQEFRNKKTDKCCKKQKIEYKNGYKVCVSCGTTQERLIENKPKRAYTQEEKNKKVNHQISLKYGPRTVIKGITDAKGRLISASNRDLYNRLSRIQASITDPVERNLWNIIPKYNEVIKRLSIPKHIAQEAYDIYLYAVKNRVTLGRCNKMILSGAIYIALRLHDTPITMEEIIAILQISKKTLHKGYDILTKEVLPKLDKRVFSISPIKYVERFISDLNLSMKCRKSALEIYEKIKRKGKNFSGKNPKGIAAALIFYGCKKNNIKITQIHIAKSASISGPTLRKNIKTLHSFNEILQ